MCATLTFLLYWRFVLLALISCPHPPAVPSLCVHIVLPLALSEALPQDVYIHTTLHCPVVFLKTSSLLGACGVRGPDWAPSCSCREDTTLLSGWEGRERVSSWWLAGTQLKGVGWTRETGIRKEKKGFKHRWKFRKREGDRKDMRVDGWADSSRQWWL